MEAEGEQDRLEVSSFLTLCNLIRRDGGGRGREQDRLKVSNFLDSVQPNQESWWRQRESKTGWR